MARVGVKVPPFWKVNPSLWFAQLEAQFANSNITVDSTKFNHVVASIESEVLSAVHDIVLNPPADDKYATLKARLIAFYAESESSKIRTLLQGLELGDQRPSYLLTRMRGLAGTHISEDLLKSMWLSRLPGNMQAILAASTETLEPLAKMADKISEHVTPPMHVHSAETPYPHTLNLENQIAELTKQVQQLSAQVNDTRRPVKRNNFNQARNRSRSRKRPGLREPENGMCFYHTNFGSRAKKCTPPCIFPNSHSEN